MRICERMRAVQGQPVSGQREEEKEKSHKGYRYSSSGYSPAVSPLSMQSNLEVLAQAGRTKQDQP